jgi:phage terminase large subunit-like protein
VNPEWSTACPDWEERIRAGRSLIPFSPLFVEQAERALSIFKALKIVDAPGSPLMGDAARAFVFDFVAAIFGSYDQVTGRQLINEFFFLISKKNSKSTTAAGIMLTALLLNWRTSAEAIILAPTKEIAKNSAEPAMDMVAEDPELRTILKPVSHLREIQHRTTGAVLKIVAADSETVGGSKASYVLIDEMWLFGKRPGAENMFREAVGGLASRPEGFVIALSTQSDEPPAGVFKAWLQRFRDIRDGKRFAPRSLGILYEFPPAMLEEGSFKDPKNWYITNPNLGASVDEQYLLDEKEKAGVDQKSLAGFFSKHLNVEIGIAFGSDRWAGAEHWATGADKTLSLDELIARSEVAVAGIDGGGLDDLLGLAIIGRCKVTRKWLLWTHAWVQRDVLTLRKEIAPRLLDFEREGSLTLCDTATQDIEGVADYVELVKAAGLLPEKNAVGLDPVGVAAMVDELATREIAGEQVVGISQGYRLSGAIWGLERKLKDGTLIHSGQTMMDWVVGNAKVEQRGNAVLITKQTAGKAKIDPLMAAFNAAMLMSRNPEPKRPPEYQILFV